MPIIGIWQVNAKDKSMNSILKKKKKIFECNGFTIVNSNLSDINKGYKCYADKWFQAVINYNGNVYKCTARDFDESNSCGYLQDNGVIKWYPEKIIERFSRASFENQICLKCKILPLCMGTCSQTMIENQHQKSVKSCLKNLSNFQLKILL